MNDYQCWHSILPQNPRDLPFTRHMYVYMEESQHFWERNTEWMGYCSCREIYLQILIPVLDWKPLRQGLEAVLDPLWELKGRRVHEPVTLTSWNSKYAWPKTLGWDVYRLGRKLSSSPLCWDLSAETDAMWILITQCPIAPKRHCVRTGFQLQTGKNAVENVKTRCVPLFLLVREEQRLLLEWEPCAWVITGGWVDKEWAREINTRTKENKNR